MTSTLEVEGDVSTQVVTVEPEISLNAITGTPSRKTMSVMGLIRKVQVVILINSGSTHNFIDPSVVQKARIVMDTSQRVTVKVANGQVITS